MGVLQGNKHPPYSPRNVHPMTSPPHKPTPPAAQGDLFRSDLLLNVHVSPEFRLAVACAMWPPCERQAAAIRGAAAARLEWPRFVRVVRRHHVIGLCHDGLTRTRLDVP